MGELEKELELRGIEVMGTPLEAALKIPRFSKDTLEVFENWVARDIVTGGIEIPQSRKKVNALAKLAILNTLAAAIYFEMDLAANEAREQDASWPEIGRATFMTPRGAHRR